LKHLARKVILTVLSGKQGLSAQHLSQNTSNTPHVDSLGVLLEGQHDLRSSVPTSSNIFSHEPGVVISTGGGSSQTKVTDFKVAVRVQKQVGGLKVTVQHIRRVHSLQSTKGLVDEVLAVVVGQILGTDNAVHIRLHQLLDEVDLAEGLIVPRLLDIQNTDDVLVVEVAQEFHLTQSSQTEHAVVEGGDLLDGHLLARWLVERGATQRDR
jgi:hypothetical protein